MPAALRAHPHPIQAEHFVYKASHEKRAQAEHTQRNSANNTYTRPRTEAHACPQPWASNLSCPAAVHTCSCAAALHTCTKRGTAPSWTRPSNTGWMRSAIQRSKPRRYTRQACTCGCVRGGRGPHVSSERGRGQCEQVRALAHCTCACARASVCSPRPAPSALALPMPVTHRALAHTCPGSHPGLKHQASANTYAYMSLLRT